MRHAISIFFISREVNLDLKSLKLRAYGLKLQRITYRATLLTDQRLKCN